MRIHGGRVRVKKDFSVNTNPLGPPRELLEILRMRCFSEDVIARYPDYEYRDLRNAISSFYNVDPEGVVVLNGSSEALPLLVLALKPARIYSLEPTFGDHRILCKALGIDCIALRYIEGNDGFVLSEDLLETACKDRSSVIIMSNPNNPTGAYIDVKKLASIATRCDATIIIDEAYAELCEECPIEPIDMPDNIAILRSLTKWLSISGLRIGFMVLSKQLSRIIDSVRQPWNINSIAECTITNLLRSHGEAMRRFIRDSREYISIERKYLSQGLERLGFRVYRSHANYILTKTSIDIDILHEELLKHEIAVRDCRSFEGLDKGYIRVSIKKRKDNEELLNTISRIKHQ
ncbi:MAG: histidinol-phosphate transaminase [Sulfolobales archaeon]